MMGDIAGQESRSVSWVVSGDKKGEYYLDADFVGTLMPFNVPVKANFKTENPFVVGVGRGLHLYIYPEEFGYIGKDYYIQYELKNEGKEPIYNLKTTFGAYTDPGAEQEITITYPDGSQEVISDKVNGYTVPNLNTCKSIPVLYGNQWIEIGVFDPGESIYGTYKTTFSGEGDPEQVRYRLIESMVSGLEETDIVVHICPIPSHVTKYNMRVEVVPTTWADPVDMTTGAFTDDVQLLSVMGDKSPLALNVAYNSLQSDASGEVGYGWSHSYEAYLEIKGGTVNVHWDPAHFASFVSENAVIRKVTGELVDNHIALQLLGEDKGFKKYLPISQGMDDYRLYREDDDTYCLQHARELKSLGISVYFEKENLDTGKMTDEMLLTIMGSLAQEESISISENTKWAIRRKMANGTIRHSSAPYGYVVKDGQLVINEEQAKVVREIFQMFLNGMGTRAISQQLEQADPDEKWTVCAIKYILRNERYIGDCLWQKKYNEGLPFKHLRNHGEQTQYYISSTHEPIIDKSTFEAAQKLIAKRSKCSEPFVSYPLSQMVICSNCQRTYLRKMRRQTICWVCRIHDFNAADCPYTGFREEQIYDAFIRLFNKLQAHYKAILIPLQSSLLELKSRSLAGNARVLDIRKETAKLHEQAHVLASLRTKGYLTEDKFHAQNAEIERKLDRLRKELHRLTKSSEEDEVLDQLAEMIAYFQKRGDIMVDFEADTFAYLVKKLWSAARQSWNSICSEMSN